MTFSSFGGECRDRDLNDPEWEQQDYREAVAGIREGYADFKAGRTKPADLAFEELREKHGLPR